MTSITTRLFVAAGLIAIICGGLTLVPKGPDASMVKLPDRSYDELPLIFDSWEGERTEMDDRVRQQVFAEVVVNRAYKHDTGSKVWVHLAILTDYSQGAIHQPHLCYRASGWKQESGERMEVYGSDQSSISVSLSTWKRKTERISVLFWYQLGPHIIIDRHDLGVARWALKGSDTWPPLVKVLMHIPEDESGEAKARIQGLAGHVHRWLSQPDLDSANQ